jgi:D-methionine transport system ATP-binding protein
MIEFKNISKFYTQNGQTIPALDQINLSIPAGSIFGIIGYSGAGKSTLVRLINLLDVQVKVRSSSIKRYDGTEC